MIVGPDFIWLHFPKCAGTALQSALRQVYRGRTDVVFDPIDQRNVIWHHSIQQRKRHDSTFDPGDRKILCGFRRLPYWLLSRVHFEAQRPPHRIVTRAMLVRGQFYEQRGVLNKADSYVKKYNNPKVDAWIRTEHLVDDLSRVLEIDRQRLNGTMKQENAGEMDYIRDLAFWFTPEDLVGLYAANPEWATVEEVLYGELVTL